MPEIFLKLLMFLELGFMLPSAFSSKSRISLLTSDIIFLSRQVANGTAGSLPYIVYNKGRRYKYVDHKKFKSRFYFRFNAVDKPGVLARIAGILGKNNVSIASVYQKEFSTGLTGGAQVSTCNTFTVPDGQVR